MFAAVRLPVLCAARLGPRTRAPRLSYRGLSPVSSHQLLTERADRWNPGTLGTSPSAGKGRDDNETALTAMAKYKSDFLNTLDARGFIHQCSDSAGLDALASKGEVVA